MLEVQKNPVLIWYRIFMVNKVLCYLKNIHILLSLALLLLLLLLHGDEKKRKYVSRIIKVENGTFTPLLFTKTGGMSQKCQRYHSRLAELISSKKQEEYVTAITWIRTKVSFAILRTALVCLRGTRSRRRKANVQENDLKIEKGLAGLT